jgi:hypothetical protein
VAISGRNAVWKQEFFWIVAFRLTLRVRLFHIADDGLPAVIHMTMFLMSAMTQGSKNLYLRRVRPHQTSRRRIP